MARQRLITSSMYLQAVFFVLALSFECVIYIQAASPFKGYVVDTILAIRVRSLRIPLLVYLIVTLTPTYYQSLSTAMVVGQAFGTWNENPKFQSRFVHNWSILGTWGSLVSGIGLPWLMLMFFVVGAAIHIISLVYYGLMLRRTRDTRNESELFGTPRLGNACVLRRTRDTPYFRRDIEMVEDIIERDDIWSRCWGFAAEEGDAANLPFVARTLRSLRRQVDEGIISHYSANSGGRLRISKDQLNQFAAQHMRKRMSRLFLVAFVKYPLLWLKISFLSVEYDQLGQKEWAAAVFAICMSGLSILQQMRDFFGYAMICRDQVIAEFFSLSLFDKYHFIVLYVLAAALVHQALHLCGVFWCPRDHEFSLLRGGCRDFSWRALCCSSSILVMLISIHAALKRMCHVAGERGDSESGSD